MSRSAAVRAVVTGLITGLSLSACSTLPVAPPDLPSTYIPEVDAPSPEPGVPVGPDGFTIAERVALRVSAVTCSQYGNGSAWVLDENTAVTNRHVIEGAVEIELTSYDGRHYVGTSSVLAEHADLALVHIEETFPETATIADSPPTAGGEVYVVGYPEGSRLTTTDGVYRGTVRETLDNYDDRVDQLIAAIKPGNSGSAVVNEVGAVVGVAYAGDGIDGAWSVTLDSLNRFIEDTSLHEPNEAECTR